MMEGAGFEVKDLGINNPVENYLDELENGDYDILGMSALLTTTMPYMTSLGSVTKPFPPKQQGLRVYLGTGISQLPSPTLHTSETLNRD